MERQPTVHKTGRQIVIYCSVTVGTPATVPDGYLLDFISGEYNLKDSPKEQVRQRVARALFHEYGISVEDMEGDFPARIEGRRKKLDIAIFHHRQRHTLD